MSNISFLIPDLDIHYLDFSKKIQDFTKQDKSLGAGVNYSDEYFFSIVDKENILAFDLFLFYKGGGIIGAVQMDFYANSIEQIAVLKLFVSFFNHWKIKSLVTGNILTTENLESEIDEFYETSQAQIEDDYEDRIQFLEDSDSLFFQTRKYLNRKISEENSYGKEAIDLIDKHFDRFWETNLNPFFKAMAVLYYFDHIKQEKDLEGLEKMYQKALQYVSPAFTSLSNCFIQSYINLSGSGVNYLKKVTPYLEEIVQANFYNIDMVSSLFYAYKDRDGIESAVQLLKSNFDNRPHNAHIYNLIRESLQYEYEENDTSWLKILIFTGVQIFNHLYLLGLFLGIFAGTVFLSIFTQNFLLSQTSFDNTLFLNPVGNIFSALLFLSFTAFNGFLSYWLFKTTYLLISSKNYNFIKFDLFKSFLTAVDFSKTNQGLKFYLSHLKTNFFLNNLSKIFLIWLLFFVFWVVLFVPETGVECLKYDKISQSEIRCSKYQKI